MFHVNATAVRSARPNSLRKNYYIAMRDVDTQIKGYTYVNRLSFIPVNIKALRIYLKCGDVFYLFVYFKSTEI